LGLVVIVSSDSDQWELGGDIDELLNFVGSKKTDAKRQQIAQDIQNDLMLPLRRMYRYILIDRFMQ
jgi:hypothetical protein